MKKFFNEIIIDKNILNGTNNLRSFEETKDTEQESMFIGKCIFQDGNSMILTLFSRKETCFIDITLVNSAGVVLSKSEPIYHLNSDFASLKIENTEYITKISTKESVVDVVSYCWTKNDSSSFDEEWENNCVEGDFIFTIPKYWLVNEIVNNSDISPAGYTLNDFINEPSDVIYDKWKDIYTHEEGYKIYNIAKKENIVSDYVIKNCDFCSKK